MAVADCSVSNLRRHSSLARSLAATLHSHSCCFHTPSALAAATPRCASRWCESSVSRVQVTVGALNSTPHTATSAQQHKHRQCNTHGSTWRRSTYPHCPRLRHSPLDGNRRRRRRSRRSARRKQRRMMLPPLDQQLRLDLPRQRPGISPAALGLRDSQAAAAVHSIDPLPPLDRVLPAATAIAITRAAAAAAAGHCPP